MPWDCKINFGRGIDNKFSSLDHLSYPHSSYPEIGVYTTVLAHTLSLSSLLTPKALGVPISLNTQSKSLFSHYYLDIKI